VHALEQLGVKYTFGIPGVQNTEFYDELNKSEKITPVLVTHEGSASFIADAVSRVSGTVGTLAIVPAAGLTHAASGIAEALLAGVPMLVITGGIRTDLGKRYQLHEIDQHAFMKPLTKATFLVTRARRGVVPTLHEAYRIATSGVPGPVFVELPVNLQLFPEEVANCPPTRRHRRSRSCRPKPTSNAPRTFCWRRSSPASSSAGARSTPCRSCRAIAEFLQAPVATTLQGQSVFPRTIRCTPASASARTPRPPRATPSPAATHARGRHALRRAGHRQLRRHGAGEPGARRHQSRRCSARTIRPR
jgi:acetolactate synthase-1/2/3 large subunit